MPWLPLLFTCQLLEKLVWSIISHGVLGVLHSIIIVVHTS